MRSYSYVEEERGARAQDERGLSRLEIGYTTPPFGLLLFVMKGVAPPGTTMRDIYLAGMPFIACVMLLIGLIIVFPPLATWLPEISH